MPDLRQQVGKQHQGKALIDCRLNSLSCTSEKEEFA
jgi:hypothetical protein